MYAKAAELAEKHGWFLTRQFENQANPDVHERTTGREIMQAFEGERLDYWVTGYGTGGTLNGVAKVLRAESPQTKIVVTEPENAALLQSGVQQESDGEGAPTATHPSFAPHPMQGWTPDFISKITSDASNANAYDCLLYTSPSPRDRTRSRMPSSA